MPPNKPLMEFSSGPLKGREDLDIISLSGTESLSALFTFEVEIEIEKYDLDASDLLGNEAGIYLRSRNAPPNDPDRDGRYIHGLIGELEYLSHSDRGNHRFSITLVPALWFLGLAERTRTHNYTDTTPKAVIEELLTKNPPVEIKFKNLSTLQERLNQTIVQYNETDLDFLLRYLATAGAAFYFEHSKDKHTLVLIDESKRYPEAAKNLTWDKNNPHAHKDSVVGWTERFISRVPDMKWSDYEVTKGEAAEQSDEAKGTNPPALANLQASMFGASFPSLSKEMNGEGGLAANQPGMSKNSATFYVEHQQASYARYFCESNCARLFAGGRFGLDKEPRPGAGTSFLVTRVSVFATDGHDYGVTYNNQVECIDATLNPRPLNTSQPRIHGQLPARVSNTQYGQGKPGDKADYGKVKVFFPWDDSTETHWLQVSQLYGGDNNSGAWFLPQVDDEVLVGFINGEPDRPYVSGALYHQKTKTGPTFEEDSEASVPDYRMGLRHPADHEISFTGANSGDGEVYICSTQDFHRRIDRFERAKVKEELEYLITSGDTRFYMDSNEIVLHVGQSTITMTKAGDITIECLNLKIDAKQTIESKAGVSVKEEAGMSFDIKSSMTTVEGSATATIKGGMVMIN
jgi:type VI secretion system secreted protein VgrG